MLKSSNFKVGAREPMTCSPGSDTWGTVSELLTLSLLFRNRLPTSAQKWPLFDTFRNVLVLKSAAIVFIGSNGIDFKWTAESGDSVGCDTSTGSLRDKHSQDPSTESFFQVHVHGKEERKDRHVQFV